MTADNIDILLTDTLDGKKTFHATQMVAFQRRAADTDSILDKIEIKSNKRFKIPFELNELSQVIPIDNRKPQFSKPVNTDWFKVSDATDLELMTPDVLRSRVEDMTFALARAENDEKTGWTEYNRRNIKTDVEKSAMGYMPLILNPAHELSTLYTVLKRCIAVGDATGHKHIVLTVDQALYCKLVELIWNSDVFKERIILRLGGLHIKMNFQKVIGKHMEGSGLSELWLESGVLAEGSIAKVLDGKAFAKSMRIHKLTFQAIWRLIYPQFLNFLEDEEFDKAEELRKTAAGTKEELKTFLSGAEMRITMSKFLKER